MAAAGAACPTGRVQDRGVTPHQGDIKSREVLGNQKLSQNLSLDALPSHNTTLILGNSLEVPISRYSQFLLDQAAATDSYLMFAYWTGLLLLICG